jgi:hypothetical protein
MPGFVDDTHASTAQLALDPVTGNVRQGRVRRAVSHWRYWQFILLRFRRIVIEESRDQRSVLWETPKVFLGAGAIAVTASVMQFQPEQVAEQYRVRRLRFIA